MINAVKFTPHGGRIEVSLRDVGSDVELVVADTGEGISAEVLPCTCSTASARRTTAPARGRMGAGPRLAPRPALVEPHGTCDRREPGKGRGRRSGHSAAGGAEVGAVPGRLWGRSRAVDPAARRARPRRGRRPRLARPGRDDPARGGAEVRSRRPAIRAHEIVTAWQPHVLVSDLAMPGEDGFMLLRAMRDAMATSGREARRHRGHRVRHAGESPVAVVRGRIRSLPDQAHPSRSRSWPRSPSWRFA